MHDTQSRESTRVRNRATLRHARISSPLTKSIRATAGPCGRNTALRALAESRDGTRLRALSSITMARPRLQSDFINGLLEPGPTWNDLFEKTWKYGGRVRKTRQCSVPEISCLNSTAESPGSQGAGAQATCVWSASDGNVAIRDESAVEW